MNISKVASKNVQKRIFDVSTDDSCSREIVFEVSLSKRLMTLEQKKEISYQLLNNTKSNNTKIETRICISHVAVGKWLYPAKPIGELKINHNKYKFNNNRHESIHNAVRLAVFVEYLCTKCNNLNIA
jgi:hypothetical protein